MNIPGYQIRNVLNVYSKQLKRNNTYHSKKIPKSKDQNSSDNTVVEGKRKAVIEKVSAEIVNNILHFANKKHDRKNVLPVKEKNVCKHKLNDKFIFNIIDNNNNKSISHITIEDKTFPLNKLK